MGPNYEYGQKKNCFNKNVQRTLLMMGKKTEFIESVPCGNTVALVGIDQYLIKTGTISDRQEAHIIRDMKYSVSAVVQIAIKPKAKNELPKLIEGLLKLIKSDPLLQYFIKESSGEIVLAASGELHAEIACNDLEEKFARIPIIKSDPIVSYKETVTCESQQAMSKSANNQNRLICSAQDLSEEFSNAVDEELIPLKDQKLKVKYLCNELGWHK